MKAILAIAVTAIGLSMTACAAPTVFTQTSFANYDKDTDYAIDELENGFALSILYSRYQFIPESDALSIACRSSLMSIAYEVGEKRGRHIDPINEQRIKISLGRNGLTGITSCSATTIATWTK